MTTPRWVYPRLDPLEASRLLDGLRSGRLQPSISCSDATPPPTGSLVPEAVLQEVRHAVATASMTVTAGDVPRGEVARWDELVGEALHATMGIIAADAAHEGVWSFLTLILLPDVAVRRFPDMHVDRMLGRQRNVFRRLWWRREVLGDLPVPQGARPLGEDEYVGIFERSQMARCRPLARALATVILDYQGGNRSSFARDLAKVVGRQTGPRLLDTLTELELRDIVVEQARALGATIEEPTARLPPPFPPPEHRRIVPQRPIDPLRKRRPAAETTREPSDLGRGRRRRSYTEAIPDLVADGRLPLGSVLTGNYRGISYSVSVGESGTLDHGNRRFTSPSEACRELTGQAAVNGWMFWSLGEVLIGELRRA